MTDQPRQPPKEKWYVDPENKGLWVDTKLFFPESYAPMVRSLFAATNEKHAGNIASQLVVRFCLMYQCMMAVDADKLDSYDTYAAELLEIGGKKELLLVEAYRKEKRDAQT